MVGEVGAKLHVGMRRKWTAPEKGYLGVFEIKAISGKYCWIAYERDGRWHGTHTKSVITKRSTLA